MKAAFKAVLVFLLFVFLLYGIPGEEDSSVKLPAGTIYVQAQKESFPDLPLEKEVAVFDENGSEIWRLESPAYIETVMLPDGTLQNQVSGLHPSGCLLFVSRGGGMGGGVWDTATRSWILEIQQGEFTFTEQDGILLSFTLGDQCYDAGFRPLPENAQPSFKIDGQSLINTQDSSGQKYIAKADGTYFLGFDDFILKNELLEAPLPQGGLEIFQTFQDRSMVVGGSYNATTVIGGKAHWRDLRYLCDSSGNILYRDWNRSSIGYAADQYGELDRRYLEFSSVDGVPSQFLDLETGNPITLPEGWLWLTYKGNGLFLLENNQEYCIYDAKTQSLGLSFQTKLTRTRIFLFGKESYALQSRSGTKYNQLFIGKKKVELAEDTESLDIVPGDTPVILENRADGTCSASYILDAEGNLLYKGDGPILSADGDYYIEKYDTEYKIRLR